MVRVPSEDDGESWDSELERGDHESSGRRWTSLGAHSRVWR